jgi:electron transfer flavoprotein beta subunit
MKIAVCLREVPGRDTRYQIAPNHQWIDESQASFEISECDEYALEAALKLKDLLGCEVVAITVGAPRAEKALRKALAMGADRGIQIDDPDRRLSSPAPLAAALREVVSDQDFQLIFTGTQSDDFGYGQTGVMLAEFLGFVHATLVMEIQLEAESRRVAVVREMESGWFQRVQLPLPAVLTVQAGGSPVRYASLKGIMLARKKEIQHFPLSFPGLTPSEYPGLTVERLYAPSSERRAEILNGEPESVVSALLDRLRREARVI